MIAQEALQWVGTPFKWGQSQKGVGCDCKGFVQGVLRELGRREADSFYATFSSYRADRPVPSSFLLEGVAALFDRVETMAPGDILLLKHGAHPAHMAIYVGDNRAVHACVRSSVKSRELAVLFHRFPLHSVWRCR